jgi:hypothetical protein
MVEPGIEELLQSTAHDILHPKRRGAGSRVSRRNAVNAVHASNLQLLGRILTDPPVKVGQQTRHPARVIAKQVNRRPTIQQLNAPAHCRLDLK